MLSSSTFYYLALACYGLAGVYLILVTIPALLKLFSSKPKEGEQDSLINELMEKGDIYEDAPGHAKRVSDISKLIAARYGLADEEIYKLQVASLLHDVGQVNNYPFLNKPEKLDFTEKTELWEHPLLSEKIVNENFTEVGWAGTIIRWHHEAWDGTGYPDRLSNESIPLPSRILHVADAYDSMIHDRPYRNALSEDQAIEELKLMSGTMFDPQVVQVLADLLKNQNN